MTDGIAPITSEEHQARIDKLRGLMREQGHAAAYLHAGTNMTYFTGTRWYASERMVAVIVPCEGELQYIAPAFERDTLLSHIGIEGTLTTWEEHESPYKRLAEVLGSLGIEAGQLAIDEATPFFTFDGLRGALPGIEFVGAQALTQACRSQKSRAELDLMQRAKDMTIEVHKAVATVLRPGISTQETTAFIEEAHKRVGAAGSSFCIVLFGEDSAYPHGVKTPKSLDAGDIVLIDTGCLLHGYNSDITRTYVFGEPTERHREIWTLEKEAQAAAFAAARIGEPCGSVDDAARAVIDAAGFGPGYALPGLPHRTGHGIGLDIHEGPYLVASDQSLLAPGMCFSNEPMICVPGEFGVRLEDHFYMTEDGARWFTQPSHSIDDPFGLLA
ncbi:MAG: Xaa-Pro dipeptidase [Planctomycetota bacterium]|jgi:Xaa-Pro dipeptidase